MKTQSNQECIYESLPVGTILCRGDEFKRKRNKVWQPVVGAKLGRSITSRNAAMGFVFRRPVSKPGEE